MARDKFIGAAVLTGAKVVKGVKKAQANNQTNKPAIKQESKTQTDSKTLNVVLIAAALILLSFIAFKP